MVPVIYRPYIFKHQDIGNNSQKKKATIMTKTEKRKQSGNIASPLTCGSTCKFFFFFFA